MQVTIQNDLDHVYEFESAILDKVEEAGYDENARFALRLALDEALINAYKHGNRTDPTRKVYIRYEINPDGVEVEIEDEGDGFPVDSLSDPRVGDSIHKTSGRGIFLIRSFMSTLEFSPRGNVIRFTYDAKPNLGINPHGLSYWRFEDAHVLELDPVRVERNPVIVLDSILQLVRDGARKVIIDMEFIDEADSAVLGLLVAAHREVIDRGGELILIRPQRVVGEILRATKLDEVLDIRPDLRTVLSPKPTRS
jgi:serine/threonine-protein kinase RsbW